MPVIKSITLKNFKGVEDVTLDLLGKSYCPVITLIGLNESGKTTILEGLSYFVSGDNSVSSLFDRVHTKSAANALVPVHRKANFTDSIKISAVVALDDTDLKEIEKIAAKFSLKVDLKSLQEDFRIEKEFAFEDSVLEATNNWWTFKLNVAPPKGSKFKKYVRPKEAKDDLWAAIWECLNRRLPRIAYFPTFLVDMPARIYLKEHDDEPAVNRYYRYVFQDILDSLNEGLSLEKHVCDRIEAAKSAEKNPVAWFSAFFTGSSKAPIDSVFQKISNAVTKEVLGSWRKIFQRAISAKSIYIEWNIDVQKGDMPYASFVVTDGESRYAISERSLGFRWFFSFLLFTAFKQGQERQTIFVFDEPAANLHAKAQAELLTSFSRIVADRNLVVYSTHSHHMINPQWLSGAYIVENSALDYDSDDAFGLSAKPTNIKITKYRDFVSQYPTRSSYFQPVIEKLEYVAPTVIGSAPYVIVEGITDYYALRLAAATRDITHFSLIPGTGAGASGPLISMLMGRGEKFVILLDDDDAGRRAKKKYLDEWYLDESRVMTLGDIDEGHHGRRLEGLLSESTISKIQERLGGGMTPTKKQIGLYLAEMCALGACDDALCDDTKKCFWELLDRLSEKLSA